MLYNYKAITQTGDKSEGAVDAVNMDVAIAMLQKKGLIISEIKPPEEETSLFSGFSFFNRVSNKDIVILSRQMATLFQAQVSALRIFRLLGEQSENRTLKIYLNDIADDIQGGNPISKALGRHPDAFSDFYVNMVKAGEESGKLDETFGFLADYLDRTYQVSSKAKNALIYPAFVVLTFIGVMVLMLTIIIPKISLMLKDSGQSIPIYTQIVLGLSYVVIHYGIFIAIALVIGLFFAWKYNKTSEGAMYFDKLKLKIPYLGNLYKKLYLSRIADNLHTMILSGIPILRALETTSAVVGSPVYKEILDTTLLEVRSGSSLSLAFSAFPEIPGILVQMVKVGEESGELGNILSTLSKFYQRETTQAVDTMVSLIEPVMIVALGVGVGVLLAAVLMPIYNIAGAS